MPNPPSQLKPGDLKRSLQWALKTLRSFDRKPNPRVFGVHRIQSLCRELIVDVLNRNPSLADRGRLRRKLVRLRRQVKRQLQQASGRLASGPLVLRPAAQELKRELARLAETLQERLPRKSQPQKKAA